MRTALCLSGVAALLAVACLAGILAFQARSLPERVAQDLTERGDALEAEIAAGREDLKATQDGLLAWAQDTSALLDRRLASLERTADARLASMERLAGERIEVLTTRADVRMGEGIAEIGKLRADLKPVLATTDELLTQSSSAVAVLRPQALKLMAASGRAMGETAQAAVRFDAALPRFIAIGERFAESSAGAAQNVERITRPDKWWITGAKIAAPVAGGLVWGATNKR